MIFVYVEKYLNNLIASYTKMLRIRLAEQAIARWVENGTANTPCHLCEGQEAIAVGVGSILEDGDTLWGNHRSHGHYLAKGGSLAGMLKEILCRETGCTNGRGGSMHLIALEKGILGTVPIVGATVPLAVGAALTQKMNGEDRVSVSFFGDGAIEEGHVCESINIAALFNLPVIFICENNLYSSHLHIRERRRKDNIVETASLFGIPGECVDGNDVEAVENAVRCAVMRARKGEGPTLLECRTFRWRGHVGHRMDVDVGVTRKGELKDWLEKCPIDNVRKKLIAIGVSSQELSEIDRYVTSEVEEACAVALNAPYPNPSTLMNHVFSERSVGVRA